MTTMATRTTMSGVQKRLSITLLNDEEEGKTKWPFKGK
jgi:hypothetical protein